MYSRYQIPDLMHITGSGGIPTFCRQKECTRDNSSNSPQIQNPTKLNVAEMGISIIMYVLYL
jgi:hypothetical protein